jgi:nucleoid DNA-binding protein
MGKITIQDMAKTLVERHELTKKEASAFVNAMFDVIQQALERDNIVKVKGFGTFKIIDVDARESVNVNTGERVLIEGHNKITFTPDTLMRELVNKPFSQFETVVLKDGVEFEDGTMVEENGEDPSSMPLVDFGTHGPSNEIPIILGEEAKPEPEPIPEPAPEPAPEPEQKPVPEPAPMPEPEPEPEMVSEPAPELEVESEQESEPEGEPEPDPEPESESDSEPEEESAYDETEEGSDKKGWLMALIACAVGLIIGYFIGNFFPMASFASKDEVKVEQPDTVKKQVSKDTATVDAKPAKPEVAPEAKPEVKPEVKPEAPKPVETKPAPQQETTQYEVDPAKYEAMDVRVRTGAYHIIGTDRVVKVKEGDNLSRISSRTLGPDMVCYLEVYNGLKTSSELKVGQEIKIPKLKLKKKKKPQTVNE